MEKRFFVYILANENRTLYVGVTSDLVKRVFQHKSEHGEGFTTKYALHKLVYYQACPDAESAIQLEKRLKHWNRAWKLQLIREQNPIFADLSSEII